MKRGFDILMTFACVGCGKVWTNHAGYGVIDASQPWCADIGQEEDRQCVLRQEKLNEEAHNG